MCVQPGHVGGLAQSCLGSDVRRREWGTFSSRFGPPQIPPPHRDESNVGGKLVLCVQAISCGSSHFSMAGLSSFLPTSLQCVNTSGAYTTLIPGNQVHIV